MLQRKQVCARPAAAADVEQPVASVSVATAIVAAAGTALLTFPTRSCMPAHAPQLALQRALP
jgi:hypothetical protein